MASKKRLTIPGRYDQITAVCAFIADGAAAAGLDESGVFGVQLACDEACTNIIEHAYGREDAGHIHVSWQISDDSLTITLRDHGRPFNLDEVASPEIPTHSDHIDQLKVGGLGIHFMRKMMDEISFLPDEKEGNVLVMVKRLPQGDKE
jgi:serine/threonine-protein kinase RsbW